MNEREEYINKFIDTEITEVPFQLNDNLKKNGKKINERTELYDLKLLVDEFIEGKKINRYLVLPGLRGVGKTTILFQIYDYLINTKNINLKQILLISCEDLNYYVSCDLKEIIERFLEKYHNKTLRTLDKDIFILIDESQYDKNWSLAGKIMFDKNKHI